MVENYKCVPSLLIKGKTFFTDESWKVTNQNQKFYNAASGIFSDPHFPPSTFHLSLKPVSAGSLKTLTTQCWWILEKKHSGK